MRLPLIAIVVFATVVTADHTISKRQVQYQFPGGRSTAAGYPASAGAAAQAGQYQQQAAARAQYQPQAAPQYRQPAAAAQAQTYDPSAYQQAAVQPQRRPVSASTDYRRGSTKYSGGEAQQSLSDEEEENKPNPLTLLLEKSTFACSGKKDGYYSDSSVNCQVFHYCVGGAKHSWMCPEGTVFHQVHLNCVPASQDICGTAEKFYFVNDYLHKELDTTGPNNTIRYAQRYYPEGYVLGDPFDLPSQQVAPQTRYQPQNDYNVPQQQTTPYRTPVTAAPYRPPVVASAPRTPVQYQPRQAPAQQSALPQQYVPQGASQAYRPGAAAAAQVYRQPAAQQRPQYQASPEYAAALAQYRGAATSQAARQPAATPVYSSAAQAYAPQAQAQASPALTQASPALAQQYANYPYRQVQQQAAVKYDDDY